MKAVISVLALLVCSLLTTQFASAETLYERTLRTGKIRAAYLIYWPLFGKDPNTKKYSGIGFDVLDLAARRLGLKMEITEEIALGTMIEGLRLNRYDIVACPLWPNATRARAADFSRPLFYSQILAYTKSGDKRIDAKLTGLNSGKFKIATIDGEMAALIASTDYPAAKRLSLPQMADLSELLLSVSAGKADITFAEPIFAFQFSKHHPNALQCLTPNNPLRIFPNTFVFNAGEEKFKAMLNTALEEIINSGELEKIISKYEPYPKAYMRVATPYQR